MDAAISMHGATVARRDHKTGAIPRNDVIYLPRTTAACQTLAGLVLSQSICAAAPRVEAARVILGGLRLVASFPDSAEIAGMLVPCCGALAATCQLAPQLNSSGSGKGNASRSGRGRRRAGEKPGPPESERFRPDASAVHSAVHLAASIRECWSHTCEQLCSR